MNEYIDLFYPSSSDGMQWEIKVKAQKLGTVTSIRYLGAVVSHHSLKPEVLSRITHVNLKR